MPRATIASLLPVTIAIGPSALGSGVDWCAVSGNGADAESLGSGGWAGAGPRITGGRPAATSGQWLALAKRHAADFGFRGRLPWSKAVVKPSGYADGDFCHNGISITFPA